MWVRYNNDILVNLSTVRCMSKSRIDKGKDFEGICFEFENIEETVTVGYPGEQTRDSAWEKIILGLRSTYNEPNLIDI